MQIQIFTIPVFGNAAATDEMNRFLRSHAVVDIEKQFIPNGNNSCWTFCVRYMSGVTQPQTGKSEKLDYKEILDADTFAKYMLLRDCRKEIALKHSVPVYLVFTNEELANIARMPEIKTGELKRIQGVGLKRVEKYGSGLIEMYLDRNNETPN